VGSSAVSATVHANAFGVIAGHSRPKDGVASLAYDPAIHHCAKKMDPRVKPAGDSE
jgi:hypothetical protein